MLDADGKVRFMPHPKEMPGWQLHSILQPGEYTLSSGGNISVTEVTWCYVPDIEPEQVVSGGEPRHPAY